MSTRIVPLAGLTAGLLAVSPLVLVARAGTATSPSGQVQTLELSVRPGGRTPNGVLGSSLEIVISLRAPAGATPPATEEATLTLPRGFGFARGTFPACTARKLEEKGASACPIRSRVGSGSVRADARPVVPTPVGGTLTAFNGGASRGLLLWQDPDVGPSYLTEAGLLPGRDGLGIRLIKAEAVLIPQIPSLTDLTLRLGALRRFHAPGGRARVLNYVRVPRRCNGGWDFTLRTRLANGETLRVTDRVPCPR